MQFLLGLVYIGKQRQTRKDGFPSREEKTAKRGGRSHSFEPLLERNVQDGVNLDSTIRIRYLTRTEEWELDNDHNG